MLTGSCGRLKSKTLASDPDGAATVTYGYDLANRVNLVTNPQRASGSPTDGQTSMTYDGQGRLVGVVEADSSSATNAFGIYASQACSSSSFGQGYPSNSRDETGRYRQYWTDAWGRVIEVDSADDSGNLSVVTCYQYDQLDDLKMVREQGSDPTDAGGDWRVRTFTYDNLSRLTNVTTPEGGSVGYTYSDPATGVCSGNTPAAGKCFTATAMPSARTRSTIQARLTSVLPFTRRQGWSRILAEALELDRLRLQRLANTTIGFSPRGFTRPAARPGRRLLI